MNARTQPTAILVHPADAARWDTIKGDNDYVLGDPGGRAGIPALWGIPVVESEAATAGVALVGDFSRAVLFDREDVQISVGTVGDDYIRNLVRVLGELRAGFAVIRPSAFVEVDLVT